MIVVCPSCKTQFEPEAAIAQSIKDDLKREYNQKWQDLEKRKEDDFKKERELWQQQQMEMTRRQHKEKLELEQQLRQELAAKVGADYEHKLRLLEDSNKTNEAKLTEARQKELEFLKREHELIAKASEIDLEVHRKLIEERNKILEAVRKEEEEKSKLRETEQEMKLKEKEKQLDDQRKLIEEMKRKSEQGSMQLQGEVQELALENLLMHAFPFDVVSEVGKGVKGADCIQTVRNNFGQECGKIIYESKRTKDFSPEWIEKLKADMRVLGADVAVIVTQAMPKDMNCFGEKDGIWICTFGEVKALVHVLRDLVIKVSGASKSQENKGDKMTLLYTYFTSREFAEQWNAIREGFASMRMSIQREREQMERLWKAREKQLEKVLLNAAGIRGSIDGISGMDVDLNLLPEGSDHLLE
ncbi:MAG: DUF2130 domain-containing protein [Bacteroidota bacterium]